MTDLKKSLDPDCDLIFERVVDLPPEKIWAAWTTPALITQWFTPAPWQTIACEIDLRPGGQFSTLMRSPEGAEHPNAGCYLEVIPGKRLIWTDSLTGDYRPSSHSFITAIIDLEPQGQGTKYTAIVRHNNEEDRQKHEAMGFYEGWGKALDQLVALMKNK